MRTQKRIQILLKSGITIADLNARNARIRQEFRVDGIHELSRRNASALLDELNKGNRRQAACKAWHREQARVNVLMAA